MVNEKRMRETFEELVRIYAPSKGTGSVRPFEKEIESAGGLGNHRGQ